MKDGGQTEGNLLKKKMELELLTFLSEMGGKVICRECELGLRYTKHN